MNRFHRHLLAACVSTLGLSLGHAGALAAGAGLTRAEVRAELQAARASNTMTPSGEIGDTAEVLAARQARYAWRTEATRSRQPQAQQAAAASLTLDQLIAELQTLDTQDDVLAALLSAD